MSLRGVFGLWWPERLKGDCGTVRLVRRAALLSTVSELRQVQTGRKKHSPTNTRTAFFLQEVSLWQRKPRKAFHICQGIIYLNY